MNRLAFTMIELIFVIVILGILAAVAIPKLAATRDDAKVSVKIQDVTTIINELGAYYTAHGTFGKIAEMTNVKVVGADLSDASAIDLNTSSAVYLDDGSGGLCVEFKTLAAGSLDGNITVTSNPNPQSSICKSVVRVLKDKNISNTGSGIIHKYGGNSVSL